MLGRNCEERDNARVATPPLELQKATKNDSEASPYAHFNIPGKSIFLCPCNMGQTSKRQKNGFSREHELISPDLNREGEAGYSCVLDGLFIPRFVMFPNAMAINR